MHKGKRRCQWGDGMSLARGTIAVFAALMVAGIAFAAPAAAAPTRSLTAAAVAPEQSHTAHEFKKESLQRFRGSFHATVPINFPFTMPGSGIRIPQHVGKLKVQDVRVLSTYSRLITDRITFRAYVLRYLPKAIRRVLVRGSLYCPRSRKCGPLPHQVGEPGPPSNRFRLRLRRGGAPKTITVLIHSPGPANREFRTVLRLQFNLVLRPYPEHKRWSPPRRVGFPVPVRCDSGGGGAALGGEGCVFPNFMPIFLTKTKNDWVAGNIRAGLQRIPGWQWLERTPSAEAKKRHRSVARYWCRKIPKRQRRKGFDCDEFPFASATPEADYLTPSRHKYMLRTQVGYVPRRQNRSEGAYLRWFYQHERIFAREEFQVLG